MFMGELLVTKMLAVCVFYWGGWKPLFYLPIHNFLQCLFKINWCQAGGGKRGSVCFLCLTKMKIICLEYFEDDLKSWQWGFVSSSASPSLPQPFPFSLSEPLFDSFICIKYICIYIIWIHCYIYIYYTYILYEYTVIYLFFLFL